MWRRFEWQSTFTQHLNRENITFWLSAITDLNKNAWNRSPFTPRTFWACWFHVFPMQFNIEWRFQCFFFNPQFPSLSDPIGSRIPENWLFRVHTLLGYQGEWGWWGVIRCKLVWICGHRCGSLLFVGVKTREEFTSVHNECEQRVSTLWLCNSQHEFLIIRYYQSTV